MKRRIIKKIARSFNVDIKQTLPRPSTRFVKKKNKNPLYVVEIGTYKGENAKNILDELEVEKMYLIDPYTKYEEYKNDNSYKDVHTAELIARDKLNKHNNKICWIKEYSNKAINKIPKGIDYIYIDGNHDYKFVKQDIELYWSKLIKGGIIGGHDINNSGVAKAFADFISENKIPCNKIRIEHPDWVVEK